MERKTKKVLFSSLLDTGLGLSILGAGLGLATPILIYVGATFLAFGLVGVTVSAVKGAAEKKRLREKLNSRDRLVEHSFGPIEEHTKESTYNVEHNATNETVNTKETIDKKLYSEKARLNATTPKKNKEESNEL